MTRVSPPDEARELSGPQVSTSVTCAPWRRRKRADHPPNAPAPTTTTRGPDFRRVAPDREAEVVAAVRRCPAFIAGREVYRSFGFSDRVSSQCEQERDARRDQKRSRRGSRHIAAENECPCQVSTAVQDLDDRRRPGDRDRPGPAQRYE